MSEGENNQGPKKPESGKRGSEGLSEREAVLLQLGRTFYHQLDSYTKLFESRSIQGIDEGEIDPGASPVVLKLGLSPGDLYEYRNLRDELCTVCKRDLAPGVLEFVHYVVDDGGYTFQEGDTIDTYVVSEQGVFLAAERRTVVGDLASFEYEPIPIDEGFLHKMASDFKPGPDQSL